MVAFLAMAFGSVLPRNLPIASLFLFASKGMGAARLRFLSGLAWVCKQKLLVLGVVEALQDLLSRVCRSSLHWAWPRLCTISWLSLRGSSWLWRSLDCAQSTISSL